MHQLLKIVKCYSPHKEDVDEATIHKVFLFNLNKLCH